jgi:hypothetical protein
MLGHALSTVWVRDSTSAAKRIDAVLEADGGLLHALVSLDWRRNLRARGIRSLCTEAAWSNLSLTDPRLPEVADQIQAATQSALRAVLDLIYRIGAVGKPVHFHLHDGHPLINGLSDHFSFFTRFPVPFEVEGRYSLPALFGADGLAAVLDAAMRSGPFWSPSFTLEIHQVDGRLPLDAASELFTHWQDLTNAERMNYWLDVLANNYLLATTLLERTGSVEAG